MNNFIYPLIITSIAGIATLLGNILLFVNLKYKDNLISFALGLSFIVMLMISVFDLIPEGLVLGRLEVGDTKILFIITLLLLLIGYFIVSFIERKIKNNDNLYKIGLLSMISLLIHNIPEGILCALTSSTNLEVGVRFSFMIMIHNIPEGICISLPIYYATKNRGKAFLYTLISSFGEITGALIALLFLNKFLNNSLLYVILIVVAGIMITLSILKILKEGLTYRRYFYLILGIIIGFIIVLLTI
ncbi:MAG TPA: ZIP family metal transporter [Candidatus Coprovivens excrementavium]|nr:ZIP family metal transporter [Candidatus Coprovivens excrementavium]